MSTHLPTATQLAHLMFWQPQLMLRKSVIIQRQTVISHSARSRQNKTHGLHVYLQVADGSILLSHQLLQHCWVAGHFHSLSRNKQWQVLSTTRPFQHCHMFTQHWTVIKWYQVTSQNCRWKNTRRNTRQSLHVTTDLLTRKARRRAFNSYAFTFLDHNGLGTFDVKTSLQSFNLKI